MSTGQRPIAREWLMTDERMGERLWKAIDRLPSEDAGIVFRHYATPTDERAELARHIAEICGRRSLTLAIAGDADLARELRAEFVHNPPGLPVDLPFSRSVHSLIEAEAANAEGADLVFVSPIFATSSHPGQKPLPRTLAIEIARTAAVPAIALGGMNSTRFAPLGRQGFYGWAGIDAWLGVKLD